MQEYKPNPNYKIKRNDFATSIGVKIVLLLNYYFKIEYKNIERLYPLAEKPFILLPRHKPWLDIPLDSLLLKNSINRYGNYIMKASLPEFIFKPLGGISIIKKTELEKIKVRKMIKHYIQNFLPPYDKLQYKEIKKKGLGDALKIVNQRKNKTYFYDIPNLLSRDEIIVLYIDVSETYRWSKTSGQSPLSSREGGMFLSTLKCQKNLVFLITLRNFQFLMNHPITNGAYKCMPPSNRVVFDGTRIKKPTEINYANLKKLEGIQNILKKPITLVPVDSDYNSKEKKIILKVGRPIELKENNLEQIVENLRNEVDSWY